MPRPPRHTRSLSLSSLRFGTPDFVIPGAQKCGTTALAVFLHTHPRLRLAATKEPDFFLKDARFFDLGVDWYRRQFPRSRPGRQRFFEASVGYFVSPEVPKRLSRFNPELKFVLMVREPAARAYSAWNMYRTLATVREERVRFTEWLKDHNADDRARGEAMLAADVFPSFSEAIDDELAAIARNGPSWTLPGLVAGGLYAAQFERFLAFFPRDRFLVLEDVELARQPVETLNRVLAFLGLPPHDWGDVSATIHAGTYEAHADQGVFVRLRSFYSEPNRRFFQLAGTDFSW